MAFPILGLIPFAEKLIDRLFPDPSAAADAKIKLIELQQNGELAELAAETDLAKGQLEINKVEAASTMLFVSGWRPFIGWVCGCGFAYHFIAQPFLAFLFSASGHPVQLPAFDIGELSTVLLGMLGLGGLRTFEKIRGVATK